MEGVLEVNVSFEYDWHVAYVITIWTNCSASCIQTSRQEETFSSKIHGIPALLTRATWKNSIAA